MIYALKWQQSEGLGKLTKERQVLDQVYSQGRQLPQWLKDAPVLWPGLSSIYAAFCELSTCRPFGMGVGPIPWTAIMQYADQEGLDCPDRADLLYLVRAMDRAYIAHSNEQSKVETKKAEKGRKIGGRKP